MNKQCMTQSRRLTLDPIAPVLLGRLVSMATTWWSGRGKVLQTLGGTPSLERDFHWCNAII